jgi:hypothetical protein
MVEFGKRTGISRASLGRIIPGCVTQVEVINREGKPLRVLVKYELLLGETFPQGKRALQGRLPRVCKPIEIRAILKGIAYTLEKLPVSRCSLGKHLYQGMGEEFPEARGRFPANRG